MSNGIIDALYDASNFLYNVREEFFYSDEMDFSMDMFTEMCNHIKNTYQIVFNTDEKTKIIHSLKVYNELIRIAYNPEMTDIEHECVSMLALIAVRAIEEVIHIDAQPDKMVYYRHDVILYDFENDTSEDVFNRIKGFLLKEDGNFYSADEAYFRL